MKHKHSSSKFVAVKSGAFTVVFSMLALLLSSITVLASERLPTEYFTDFSKHLSVQLSPGGDFLSVEVMVGTETQVVILDTKTMKPIKNGRHRFMRENFSVSGHSWVSDDRLVFRAERFMKTEMEVPIPLIMLYAVDYDGKRENVLAYLLRARSYMVRRF